MPGDSKSEDPKEASSNSNRDDTDNPENYAGENDAEDSERSLKADFTILSMAPLDGYQVSVDVIISVITESDKIKIIHQNDTVVSCEKDGRYDVAGEESAPLHYEEVEEGDRFAAVAMDDNGEVVEKLEETYAVS